MKTVAVPTPLWGVYSAWGRQVSDGAQRRGYSPHPCHPWPPAVRSGKIFENFVRQIPERIVEGYWLWIPG